MSVDQFRETNGQWAAGEHTDPEVTMTIPRPDVEGLRETLVDFLYGSLPGFGFEVDSMDIEREVDQFVGALRDAHAPL